MKKALILSFILFSLVMPAQASKARQKALQAGGVPLPLHRIGPPESDPKKKVPAPEEKKDLEEQKSQNSQNPKENHVNSDPKQ